MSTITYENITVDGFPFTRIREVTIKHEPNMHAFALVVGEISKEDGEECLKRADETTGVTIHTTAEEQNKILFFGGINKISLEASTEYYILKVELVSVSSRLDIQKRNKSFQNKSKTYGQILNEALGSDGHVDMAVTDRPTGELIMQYNESNWQFIIRIASKFNAPVLVNIAAEKPLITVGLPSSGKSYELETVSFEYGMNANDFQTVSQNSMAEDNKIVMPEDFEGIDVDSYIYGYVGELVNFNGKTKRIKSIVSRLDDGILINRYSLAGSGSSADGSAVSGFVQPIVKNEQSSGRMFTGEVKEVVRDKVKVHLFDIDDSFDGGTTHWFPYSTAYSSSDGSGWYCMPEIGDTVRVFFPSNNEDDAFAVSSVNVSPLANPRHKSWKAPGGKEILLTDDGLCIICDKDKIFIDLTDKRGINIYAEKNIGILSKGKVSVISDKGIELKAKNFIHMGTSNSHIKIKEDSITVTSKQVRIN